MNLRKGSYFKPLCLLVAALFTGQCVSYERKLVSTEEKVIEDGGKCYIYELEKIKTPSAQDPTVEYRIVKFPANKVESLDTYQTSKKVKKLNTFVGGFFIGAFTGLTVTPNLRDHSPLKYYGLKGYFLSGLLGGLIASAISSNKVVQKAEVKTSKPYLKKKPDSPPIPAQSFPLEFKWRSQGESQTFKTRTDEQGFVKVNLIDNLKMTKFPPDQPLTLYIYYLNPESQKSGILFGDSLGPESKQNK